MGGGGSDHLVKRILTINLGSSTLKCGVLDEEEHSPRAEFRARWSGSSATWQTRDAGGAWSATQELSRTSRHKAPADASEAAARWAIQLDTKIHFDALVHRIVHGGRFASAQPIRDETLAELAGWSHAAPLHQPGTLAVVDRFAHRFGDRLQIACFDTTFFHDLPERAKTFAVPAEWTERYGLRRFGFHGLSHQYVADAIASKLPTASDGRLISCHLGSGCSVAAIANGKAVDTTMGWTPLSGLMMGTRSGSVDADMILHLIRDRGLEPAEIGDALTHRSGLLGVSRRTADFQELSRAAEKGHRESALAMQMFEDRVAKAIAEMATVLGGIDILAMTGGIGQNDLHFRRRLAGRLAFLGLSREREIQLGNRDTSTTSPTERVAGPMMVAIEAREDLTMRRQAIEVIRERF